MATIVGDAIWRLGADDSDLKEKLKSSSDQVKSFGENLTTAAKGIGVALTAVGAAITGSLGAAVNSLISAGDQFDKMSLRTNWTVESLSAMEYALGQTGVALSTFERSTVNVQKHVQDFIVAGDGAGHIYEQLGLSVAHVESMNPEQLWTELAKKIAGIQDPTVQAAWAMEVFGRRAGPELLPFLKQGEDGIDALMQQAHDLGFVMSAETAADAAALNDALDNLWRSLEVLWRTLAEALLPILTEWAEKATELVQRIRAWMEENQALIETLTPIVFVIGAVASVLGPLILSMVGMATAIKSVITIFGALKAIVLVVGAVLSAKVLIIAAVVAAVVGLGVLIYQNWQSIADFAAQIWEGIFNGIMAVWDGLSAAAIAIWGGITNFIVGGFNYVYDTGKAIWDGVKNFFISTWETIRDFFVGIWDGLKQTISDGVSFFTDGLAKIGEVVGWLGEQFAGLFKFIVGGAQYAAQAVGLIGNSGGGGIQARADGGSVNALRPYLVGERGPELFVPSTSGTILNAEQTRSMGGDVNINVNIPSMVVREEADVQKISRDLAGRVSRSISMGLA